MLSTIDHELLAEDARRIAAEDAAEKNRLQAVLDADRAQRERQIGEARAEEEREQWRSIIGTCAYLDSMPESRKDILIRAFRRMAADKPERTGAALRAVRMIRPVVPVLEIPREEPITLIAPLTAEQAEAVDLAHEARQRVEDRIAALHQHRVARHAKCGRTRTIHLRRDRDGGAVEDLLIRPRCGRHDCPHCWRRRLTRCYRRATSVLLHESAESSRPRVGVLHVAEIDWLAWDALDRSIRRQHGGDVGRIRIRRSDPTVLVICAQPFRRSRPVSPAEALDLASEAISQLHTARHSYRQLGDWSDATSTEWRLIARLPGELDLGKVSDRLLAAGRKSRRIKTPELHGLIWRVESEMAAVRLETLIVTPDELCPSIASGRDRSPTWPYSDAPPDEWRIDDDCRTPWDDDAGPGGGGQT